MQLEYTWLRSLMKKYVDFLKITEDSLDFAMKTHEIDIKFKNQNALNIKLIDYSFVRNIFRPNKKLIDKLIKESVNFFEHNKKDVVFPRQITWPINSNKHLFY